VRTHRSLTQERVAEITAARSTWLEWAQGEKRRAEKGHALMASAGSGFAVVAAYDRELETGEPHCSCCQRPSTVHRHP